MLLTAEDLETGYLYLEVLTDRPAGGEVVFVLRGATQDQPSVTYYSLQTFVGEKQTFQLTSLPHYRYTKLSTRRCTSLKQLLSLYPELALMYSTF